MAIAPNTPRVWGVSRKICDTVHVPETCTGHAQAYGCSEPTCGPLMSIIVCRGASIACSPASFRTSSAVRYSRRMRSDACFFFQRCPCFTVSFTCGPAESIRWAEVGTYRFLFYPSKPCSLSQGQVQHMHAPHLDGRPSQITSGLGPSQRQSGHPGYMIWKEKPAREKGEASF